jgi:HTH-type transcriptional regulator / antitoxin HigA
MEIMKASSIIRGMKPKTLGPFVSPRNEKEFDRAVEVLGELMDQIGDNPTNPRYRLIETLSVLVEAYDAKHHIFPKASAVDVLRYLMEEHGLAQSDLPEIGSQGVVSEVLRGRRELNLRQIRALAARFGLGPEAFLSS